MIKEPIVINNFQKGIAESPHFGFGDMRNLDLLIPGTARIGYKAVKKSGTIIENKPNWFSQHMTIPEKIACLDAGQKFYLSSDGGESWTKITGNNGGFGQGLVFWKGYWFVFRTTTIDILSSPYGSANWTLSWKTIDSDGDFHPAIWAQNDKLYFGAGRYVGSIMENDGQTFDPSNAATYTFTQQALDLPANCKIRCISELGSYLLLGVWQGSSSYDYPISSIYKWDRVSASFEYPLQINDTGGIYQMININNLIYFIAGNKGKIYITDGNTIKKISELPLSIVDVGQSFLIPNPGAIINYNNRLLFGTGAGYGIGGMGVWSLNNGKLTIENIISTGEDGSSSGVGSVNIGCLLQFQSSTYLIGWLNGSTYGIDRIVNDTRYTSYQSFIESQFYKLGTKRNPVTLEHFEIHLDRPLTTDQGIKFKYRLNLNDSWTTLETFDFATDGGVSLKWFQKSITNIQSIQFRIELTTGSSSLTTPILTQIIIQ